jgi:WD40 repeat protein
MPRFRILIFFTIITTLIIWLFSSNQTIEPITSPPNTVIKQTQSILTINDGEHNAIVNGLTFTPDGKYLVSAGNDKVVRVWDASTAKTIRTLRGQISLGQDGEIYALALSPDGKWLATGGLFTGTSEEKMAIRLYDFDSGELITLLTGHKNTIQSLAFSPNSEFMISGSSDQTAILWDIETKEKQYILNGHIGNISAVAFTSDSKRVITAGYDKTMRFWQVDTGELLKILKGHKEKITAVVISSKYIASASLDKTIRLWSAKNGRFIKTFAKLDDGVSSLAFSKKGNYLVSGGTTTPVHCHVWSISKFQHVATYKGHNNKVSAIAISPNGEQVASVGGNKYAIDLWNLTDAKHITSLGGTNSNIWSVGFSSQHNAIAWGKKLDHKNINQRGVLEYSLSLPKFTAEATIGIPRKIPKPSKKNKGKWDFIQAQDKWSDWSLYRRPGGKYGYFSILDINHNNITQVSIKRGMTNGYRHLAYSFTPDGNNIISAGANGVIAIYNRDGKKLGNYIGHIGNVRAIAISADGRFLVSGGEDGTVRLWNLKTYENILTLYHEKEWIAWLPTGHYISSATGDKLIGWQINNGIDKAADYVEASQLYKHLYRPDIVSKAIRTLNHVKDDEFQISQLNESQPPQFQIISSANSGKEVSVELAFDASESPVQTLDVYINDRLVKSLNDLALEQEDYQKTLTIPVEESGINNLQLTANNDIGSTTQNLQIESSQESKQGDLYLLVIGVGSYIDYLHYLKSAAADAVAIYQNFTDQQTKTYNTVHGILLTNGVKDPTKDNITDGLELFKKAGSNDTVIFFFTGYGLNQEGKSYILPSDAKILSKKWQTSTILDWQVVQNALATARGRRILLIDSSHIQNTFNPRLLKNAANANIAVISSTNRDTITQKINGLSNGIFTHSIVRTLNKPYADTNKDNLIELHEFSDYISKRIDELSNGKQTPMLYIPKGMNNFVILKR